MNATNERRPRKVDWPYVGGEPVMPGDTLWDAEGLMVRVMGVEFQTDNHCVLNAEWEFVRNTAHTISTGSTLFSTLTRTRPAEATLDRDGVKIETGDTLYGTGRDQGRFAVAEPYSEDHLKRFGLFGLTVKCTDEDGGCVWCDPKQLTHVRPDSWGRLVADAEKTPCRYFDQPDETECDECPGDGIDCDRAMAADIVRRARALAGVTDDE